MSTPKSPSFSADGPRSGFLDRIRVIEVADERGEYCGKVLAGCGAEVIKLEPPAGEATRGYGPFLDDEPGHDRSLYFWHYNFAKKSVRLDLERAAQRETFLDLVRTADVLLEARPGGYMQRLGLDEAVLRRVNPRLVYARISPFGDSGPWAGFEGSDLVHLALGGIAMNCGYDADPLGHYELPPIAPQMGQSYHIAGELTAIAVLGALYHRESSGEGQYLCTPVHQAVAQQTETDLPNWIYGRLKHFRNTCRHSKPTHVPSAIAATKDGRWLLPYRSYLSVGGDLAEYRNLVAVLAKYGMAEDLGEDKYRDDAFRSTLVVHQHINDVIGRFINAFMFERDIWKDMQEVGATWAPLRLPEENIDDPHWKARQTFLEVEHPEMGRSFTEIGAKWMCPELPWRSGPRAPLLGEHDEEVLGPLVRMPDTARAAAAAAITPPAAAPGRARSLAGVRVIDLGWLLASSGATRFLSAQGAEVIKVEHRSRWDLMRWGDGRVGPGGRGERDAMSGPIVRPQKLPARPESPNRSGVFMEINAGKRAISLNLKKPRAREILAQLVKGANALTEGFSPGTLDRMGFGYDRLRELNPAIVYAQQSGMGQIGPYGRLRSYGPVAQALSGLSEMSGLPPPFPPAGIGYSYLDWFGAYNMATAVSAGLYRQRVTGKGCWIDSSQVEAGTYLTGTAVLDYSANARHWRRIGNASPSRPAAPHGIYRTAGDDRWIAIACFSQAHWTALVDELGRPAWTAAEGFSSLEGRLARAARIDELLTAETASIDGWALMQRLQERGVPAGVCQTAEDRYEIDPQLRHLRWLVELEQAEIGRWPVKEFPVHFSVTPPDMGGTVGRHGPSYAEDNDYVFGELLGFSSAQIRELVEDDVI